MYFVRSNRSKNSFQNKRIDGLVWILFNIQLIEKFNPHFMEKVNDTKILYAKRQLNKKNVVRTVIK